MRDIRVRKGGKGRVVRKGIQKGEIKGVKKDRKRVMKEKVQREKGWRHSP
jgi:hypothetical protein